MKVECVQIVEEHLRKRPSLLGKRYALWMISCLFITAAYAAKMGDPAAPLRIGEWIKGGPVTLADGKDKTVYVIEFWATWCGPCRESIPHLTELQAKFKDKGVAVIGITDESPNEAKPFVKKMGEKMKYAVGVDDKGQTSKAYLEAYRQDGIPTAFVVDKTGNVVWVGHPMEGLDNVLEQVVAGQFVPGAEVKAEETAEAEDESNTLLDGYFEQAVRRGGKAEAAEIGEKIMKMKADDTAGLNQFAWKILTDTMLLQRDYPLALRAAQRAFEKTDGKDCPIVDTYARAMFMNGRTNEAIAMQQQAIGLCSDPKTRLELKETLAGYRHPAPDPGPDDNDRMEQFISRSLELIAAKKTVPLDKLLAEADLKPCAVKLASPCTSLLPSEKLYEQASQSVLLVGVLSKTKGWDDWDAAQATGFLIHESGIFVTNFHVLDTPGAAALTAMTADGHVYAVKSVLAVSPAEDIAICQLEGASGLKPLAIVPNAKPGSHIRILSHPTNAFNSLTEGILSRYFVCRANGKTTTVLATTADFAVGSSGGPLFDDNGNVVGMVMSTSSVYSGPDDASGEEETKETGRDNGDNGELQMIMRVCIPAADILKLVTVDPAKR